MQHIVCNAVCYCVCLGLCVNLGVHNEGAGREVQAAGSSGGSNAEGPEIPSTAEGRHIEPTQHQHRDHGHATSGKRKRIVVRRVSLFRTHSFSIFQHPKMLFYLV